MNEVREIRKASTVVMVREREGAFQVYLLRRSGRSGFMAGNYVFPGGTVDPEDGDAGLWERVGETNRAAASRLSGSGFDAGDALVHAVAAIRETFEEAGVLLAEPGQDPACGLEDVCRKRLSDTLSRGWLRDLILAEGWIPEIPRLASWSHWVTPTLMPRRYDTRFFIAFMPRGQRCEPDNRGDDPRRVDQP